MDKAEIRRRIRRERASLTPEKVREKSTRILYQLLDVPVFKKAKMICLYLSIQQEVDTAPIISACREFGKRTAAPRIIGDRMEFFLFDADTTMTTGAFGIQEPAAALPVQQSDLILMPGIAFDENRHRIGFGGGYYDRYLAAHPDIPTIALAYELQILPEIPADPYDICPQMIITENRILS